MKPTETENQSTTPSPPLPPPPPPPPPPLPPRTQPSPSINSIHSIKSHSIHHSHSISQWAINHFLPSSSSSLFNKSTSTSNSTWPPDEWFEPYSPKSTNQSTSSSTTTTTSTSTSYPNNELIHQSNNIIIPRRLPPKLSDKPNHQSFSSSLFKNTKSISNLNFNSDHQSDSSCNRTHHTIIMDSPKNNISVAPIIPSRITNPIITDSPINTISLGPSLDLSQTNPNHQSSSDQNFIMESPTNTISLAPIQSEGSDSNKSLSSNCSPLMESPTNTTSLAPTIQNELSHELNQSTDHQPTITNQTSPITPTIPNLMNSKPLPLSPSNPTTLTSPSTPSSITQSSRPLHTFHPPPLHPDLRPSKTVKETLDAHLYRSHDGHRQVNQYILKHDLGRGSFGAVRLAVDAQTGLEYAVKEFSKKRLRRKFGNVLSEGNEDALHLIRNEVAIMKKVQHPNIVKLYEVLDVEGEDSLYMVMEYCRGGRIESGIEDHELIRRYFRQLIIGIDYLHQNEIIHHDIKPDNILLSSDRKQIKIVDFGISALFESSHQSQPQQRLIGSPAFLSPEIINGNSSGGIESDIWAMGVTLYCMVEGKLPFGEKGEALDLYHEIQEEAPNIPERWDSRLIDLIAKMLEKDYKSRIKLNEISSHLWITDSGRLSNLILLNQNPNPNPNQKINKIHSEIELRECLKIGLTDQCEKFKEIVESSLKIGKGKRKEFFKEFYRLLAEKSVLMIEKKNKKKISSS